jgi:transposase
LDGLDALPRRQWYRNRQQRSRAQLARRRDRKNYLFAGSDAGGERAASFYRLIGTARLNGLEPQAYLRIVLERIAAYPINRVDELLPCHLANASAEELRQAA